MTQIADFQSKRQEAGKNITAYGSVLNNIDAQLDPKEKKTLENSLTKSNQDILATRNRLTALNDEYIKSNFDVRYKTKIDSLQNALTANINDANDKRTSNIAVNVKPDLVKEKLNTEINLEMAKNSVASLDNMVNSLTSKLNVLAPNQANIQASEKEIENESREYVDLVNKFNQTKLESSFPIRLRQVEMAMPEIALPSRRIIMVILGGIVSFLFAVGVLFLMFYFDHSINNAQELADSTQQPVLGTLSIMRAATLDPHALWEKTNDTTHLKQFKSQLRSIRFEIDNDLADSKIIAVTSLQPSEGKTFLALNLAYAYKMINKRVLLIDGNFDNPTMREILNPDLYLEDFLQSNQNVDEIFELDKKLVVMGNKGEDVSLLEISNHSSIQSKLQVLRDKFDIILIEISSLDTFNKAREWISFSDKVVPVFAAGQNITKGKKKEIDYLSSLNGRLAGWVMNKVVNENVTTEKPKAAKKLFA
jgi:Mrp family chromosome partitioning ATPase